MEYRVDEIIAKAFYELSDQYISHKDGNYLNDRLENLEYTTIEKHLEKLYGSEWKKIDGNEKYYVSKSGQIWSSYSSNKIQQQFDKGYKSINIGYPKPKFDLVHRIVAKTFIDNPNNLPYVNHIDNDIENNCVENLVWSTQSEIIKDKNQKREEKRESKEKKDLKDVLKDIKLREEKGDIGFEFKEYPNYVIYRDGQIFSKKSNSFLEQNPNGSGYLRVEFSINGNPEKVFVHVLVATAYLSHTKLPEHTQVNHKDFNKLNNTVENLEWCTSSENNRHSKENNREQYTHLQKKVAKLDPETCEIIEVYDGLKEACRKNAINGKPLNSGTMSKLCNKAKLKELSNKYTNKKEIYGMTGGFRWKLL